MIYIKPRDGVIRPERPTMSTFSLIAASTILSHDTITPMSMTLQYQKQQQQLYKKNKNKLTFKLSYYFLLVIIAAQNYANNILANVVDVSFYCRQQYSAIVQ